MLNKAARVCVGTYARQPTKRILEFLGWPSLDSAVASRMAGFISRLGRSVSPVIRRSARVVLEDALDDGQWASARWVRYVMELLGRDTVAAIVDGWETKTKRVPAVAPKRKPHPALYCYTNDAWRLWMFGEDSFNTKVNEKKAEASTGKKIPCWLCGEHPDNGRDLIKSCYDQRVRDTVDRVEGALWDAESPLTTLLGCLDSRDERVPWETVLSGLNDLWEIRRKARLQVMGEDRRDGW